MNASSETYLKACILTHGVVFSDAALKAADERNAKRQNLVYNAPVGYSRRRPQELFLINREDGYQTVVSCVSSRDESQAVFVDAENNGDLVVKFQGQVYRDVQVRYVPEPSYYTVVLSSGEPCRKYVSACGWDELNIIPWKGCALGQNCLFCGANHFIDKDELHAGRISQNLDLWNEQEAFYLANLTETIEIALKDECYQRHFHAILISGNLSDDLLDEQARIYCRIARHIRPQMAQAREGLVAVMTPPRDVSLLEEMKNSGIDVMVFNLEVSHQPWSQKYCPGKLALGNEFFESRLLRAAEICERGCVWSNFVLGLEPLPLLLETCEWLAERGIIPSANVLHMDFGNRLDCAPPTLEDVLLFYAELNRICVKYGMKPYYCANALRTSLTNEAWDGRICFDEVHG